MIELLASEFRIVAQDFIAWALCLAALVYGSGPERVVAATWIFLFEIVDGVYHAIFDSGTLLTDVDLFHAWLDGMAGFAWITIALYANRNYPLWVAGMQLLAITAHVARGMVETVSPIAYVVMIESPGWFQLLFLGIGLTRHILRKRKYGPYRDWRVHRGWLAQYADHQFVRRFLSILSHDFFAQKSAK